MPNQSVCGTSFTQSPKLQIRRALCTSGALSERSRVPPDDSTKRVAKCVQLSAHKSPIEGCALEIASRESGWETPLVLELVEDRMQALSRCVTDFAVLGFNQGRFSLKLLDSSLMSDIYPSVIILACTRDDVVEVMLGSPALVSIDEDHAVNCMLTLRNLLPEADVSKVILQKPELLLREDAMDKSREAVMVLTENGHNPSKMVQDQPFLLLYHHIWFSGQKNAGEFGADDLGAMLHDG
eukprot:1180513-Prorocentrum_minimum.AAC.3